MQIGTKDYPGSACYDEYAENFSLAHFWVKSPIYVLLFLAEIIPENMDKERENSLRLNGFKVLNQSIFKNAFEIFFLTLIEIILCHLICH